MRTNSDLILLDAGNTHLKVAHVLNGEIFDIDRITFGDKPLLENYFQAVKHIPKALTSVLSKEQTFTIISIAENCKVLDRDSTLPITLGYSTPETLGFDRICNASALSVISETKNTVSIDIGTCIKFDFVQSKTYKGGSISPGIRLRYKSLNDYTANSINRFGNAWCTYSMPWWHDYGNRISKWWHRELFRNGYFYGISRSI